MGTIGSGGQIRKFRRHADARMGVVGEGAQGDKVGSKRKGRKSVATDAGHKDGGVVATQRC